jgi:hypothetical protein
MSNPVDVIKIEDNVVPINVTVENHQLEIIGHVTEVGPVGPKGEQGIQGNQGLSAYDVWLADGNVGTIGDFLSSLTDRSYVHDQIVAAKIWIIKHPLDKYPSVTIVDTGNNVVGGDVNYISKSELVFTSSAEFSGKAYLN